ncbi:MAG TPA: secretin N-terminal domain-containing protein [Thermoanaerobaculia bacterium]
MRPSDPRTSRRPFRRLAMALLLLASTGCAAHRVFRSAEEEERAQHWDLAVLAYQKAAEMDPENLRYKISLTRARNRSALVHYDRGRLYRTSGNLDLALIELEQAVAVDPTIATAQQELQRVKADIAARQREIDGGTPVEKAKAKTRGVRANAPLLIPSSTKPIDLIFTTDTPIKKIYTYLGTAAGINIIFDPQLKDDKFSLDLRNVTFQKALETVLRQAGHFYKVLDEKTIIVAQDNTQNRKEYEDLVIRTFFLSNGDVKDVSAMIRSILDLRRLGTIPQLNAIVIRDTADKVAVAEKIIEINDKAQSEVLIDVELVVLDTTKALELGAQLSAYTTTAGLTAAAGSTSGSSGSLPWAQIWKLGLKDFSFTIPTVTFNFIKNNSDAEVLAKPQLRIAEGAKAQLIIGNKVPIPMTTINTQQAIGGTGIVPITSFQYQDIGIKIDIEPRVHHNKEVTLKLTVEASTQNGSISSPSGDQPIIGTRTITSTIRLKDGETSILAGLIRTDKTKTRNILPFLGDLPLIGALFNYTKENNSRTDLLMTLTPHIVRSPSITEEDLIPVWVGTENNVSFSGKTTQLESPRADGSPFDPVPGTPARVPAGTVAPAPGGTQAPSPRTLPGPGGTRRGTALQGGPGESSLNAVPGTLEAQPATGAAGATVAAAATAATERSVSLTLDPSASDVAIGGSTTVSITGGGGVSDLNALEVTVEWDPALAEVNGISTGPWAKSLPPGTVRFEADRVPGKARLVWNRVGAGIGLPEGVLAGLSVKGTGQGRAVFRVTTGSALGRNGPVRPLAVPAAIRIGEPAIPKA